MIANNPGPFTYTGSGSYILGHGEVAIIDPGPHLDAHLDSLIEATNGEQITDILITHTHSDHCGGARALAERTGARIHGYSAHPIADRIDDAPALDEGADYKYRPDIELKDGDVVEGETWRVTAIHTPGHLSNHLCFASEEHQALFSGDHIMGWATTVVAPPDGDMNAYLASLDTLLARDDLVYWPTHGAPIDNPKRFVRAVKAHRLMRDAQITTQLEAGHTTIAAIVDIMYADVDPSLHKAAALNVYAHLIRLVRNGNVICEGTPQLSSQYAIATQHN